MCKNRIWKRLSGIVLSGVLLASMGMTAFAEETSQDSGSTDCPPAPTCTCSNCTCSKETGVRCIIFQGHVNSGGVSGYITSYCWGDSDIVPDSSQDEPSAEEKLSTAIDMEISRQVDQAIAAALEAGQTEDDAKGAVVVKLNSKYLGGTNGFYVSKMKDFQDANVAIDFEYDYDGNHYSIHMPAGQIPIDEDIPVYGPLYLAKIFSEGLTVTPIVEEAE